MQGAGEMNEQLQQLERTVDDLLGRLNVGTVFGAAQREGDETVIPVAEVNVAFGYGYGYGSGEGPGEADGEPDGDADGGRQRGEGGGGGLGARGGASPRGYIRVRPDGVRYEPIVDQTRLGLAGIAMSAWIVFWIAKTIRDVMGAKGG